jgi:GxxExxY protein
MTENEIARIVVDAAFKIHKTLGPGLFESVYEAALEFELQKRGLGVVHQVGLPVRYEEVKLELGFRVDLIVDGKVIVEMQIC